MIKKIITSKLTLGQQVTAIVVEAYVNFDLPPGTGLPNIKFDKPITIALTVADCSKSSLQLLDDPTVVAPDDTMPAPNGSDDSEDSTLELPDEALPAPDDDPSAAVSSRRRSLTLAKPVVRFGP